MAVISTTGRPERTLEFSIKNNSDQGLVSNFQAASNPRRGGNDQDISSMYHQESMVFLSSQAEQVEKLLRQKYIGDSRPNAVLNRMKLLTPGESSDADFWKLLYFKNSSYVQLIVANTFKIKPIESLAEMADNIIENAGPPRIKEVPYTSCHISTKNEASTPWEEHMLGLEGKLNALTLQKNHLSSHPFNRCRHSQSSYASKSRNHESRGNNICEYHRRYGSFAKLASPAVLAEIISGHSSNRLSLQDRNPGISYLIDSGAEISILPSTSTDRTPSNHPPILAATNGSPIKTYGQKSIALGLGLCRTLRWNFIIADVYKPIIGVDFPYHFELLINLR
ncbi:unnamed protein product [Hymenolepis diminuta]|uniref:Peptidase A2 domain-containing protein n=1 Tax=Hymenolepis diminuta TaxID=6216 RepID=A0A564YBR0_HYMDI|nr:unnamed protein product [Hymenolepis diminuta]